MKERLDYIDRAKGILIILAVIGHIWQSGYIHNVIYAFHMPAFFVISGILLSYTKSYNKSRIKFILSRVYSFGIPLLFMEGLGCVTDILRHGITLNIKGYMYHTITMHFNDPNVWFLRELFLVEVLFVIVSRIIRSDKLNIAAAISLFAVSVILPEGNRYVNIIVSVFRYYLYFTAGFYGLKILKTKNIFAFVLSAVSVFIIAAVFGKRADGYLSLKNIALLVSGFIGTYAVIYAGQFKIPEKLSGALTKAGANTIIIYATHHLIYAAFGVLLGVTDYATTPIVKGLIILLAVVVVEVPVIYVINRWLPFLAGKHYRKKILK